jgi:hypothetical protein
MKTPLVDELIYHEHGNEVLPLSISNKSRGLDREGDANLLQ